MGDAADLLEEAMESTYEYHVLGWCRADDYCAWCEYEYQMYLRGPGDVDEMDRLDD